MARCDREVRCAFLDAPQSATCRARLESGCQDGFKRVQAGSVSFDGAAARRCVDAITSQRCVEGPFAELADCAFASVFEPAAGLGTPCTTTGECVGGFCFGGARECKVCRAYVGPGLPCNLTDKLCDPGSSFCGTQPDAGSACLARLANGLVCSSNRQCAGEWCNWNSNLADGGPDVCGHLAVGQPCGDWRDCVPAAYCAGFRYDGLAVTPGVCATRVALGEPCLNAPEDDGCVAPASCLGGLCAEIAPYSLDAGSECERALGQCAETLYCKDFDRLQPDGGSSLRSGTCTPRLGAGAPCAYYTYFDSDCQPALTCGYSDTCVARQPANGTCAAGYECKDFLSCPASSARCEPYRNPGESCGTPGIVCADGARDGICVIDGGAGRCAGRLGAGASCSPVRPDDCGSGRCFAPDGGTAASCQPACFP
ncbi:MAG: hypothetical protein ACYC8T_36455 [Myxococcaceae bacterium]